MKRLLFFTGYRMIVHEWSGRKLNSSIYFEPNESGLELFEDYLNTFKNEPVRMLVDLIEEEFRQIEIPSLRGADRQEIINRSYNKFFRNTKYNFSKTIKISKKERKEEKILIAGLTNQGLMRPWLDIINKTATPLSGILSLPILSEDLISTLKPKQRCVIIASQQVQGNLRQSVFVNDKLMLSRLVPIASFYQGDYAEDIIRDIEGTKRYLVSQKIIDRSDLLSIQILCNDRHYPELKRKCAEAGVDDFSVHNIAKLIEQEQLQVEGEQEFSTAIFSYNATKKYFANHYAKKKEKRYFIHYLSALASNFISASMVAISVGLFSILILNAMAYQNSTKEMQLLEKKYRSKFNRLNEKKRDTATSTTNMKNIVQVVNRLDNNYLYTPYEMFAMISQDISLFPNMRLLSLDWFVSSSMNAEEADKQSSAKQEKRRSTNRRREAKSDKLYEIVNVDGELLNFDGDYRYALSLIDDIEDTMRVSNKYNKVEITRRPLNIESSKSISGDVGKRYSQVVGGNNSAEFSFRLVREIKLNEK